MEEAAPPRILGPRLSRALRAWFRGPAHPAKIRMWYALRRATGFPRIQVPYAGGVLSVDERDLIGGRLFVDGVYETEVAEALRRLLRPGDVFWDVGAHIGTFSVVALGIPDVTLVAFEPAPDTRAVLRANLALNGGRHDVLAMALGATHGTAVLHQAPQANTGLSSLVTDSGHGGVNVEATTADALIEQQRVLPPDVVKMDVEGWETEVLRGATRLLAHQPPRAIVVEAAWTPGTPGPEGPTAVPDPAVADLLRGAGYILQHVRRSEGHTEERENFLAVYEGAERTDRLGALARGRE